ncbi:MAG: G/U mismatch-specific DNA glycosylase [Actinomycetota bacterium]|nr:G/U mismatch-specific DNA glycosylase [Actinomycetota bacterium]
MAKPLPDVVAAGIDVLFCGINPSLISAQLGHHYARPGNRFWPALHRAGFTPRLLAPSEDHLLPRYGLGLTNLVDRPTASASELTAEELRAGAAALEHLVEGFRPTLVCVVGLAAWRGGFGRPRAGVGPQAETVGGRPAWVVPNPSGLNAHYQLPQLAALLAEVRRHVLGLREAHEASGAAPRAGAR